MDNFGKETGKMRKNDMRSFFFGFWARFSAGLFSARFFTPPLPNRS